MYTVEFLVIVSSRNTNTLRSFKNLLLSDDDIEKLTNSTITVNGYEFRYKLETGKINADKNPTYFVLHLSCNQESEIVKFVKSVRIIRSVLSLINPTVYKLWDDVAQYYSEKAYKHIYFIENLMRKLLTKFMYINLGVNWTNERTPEEVSASIRLSKKDPNFLHNVDFIQLSRFLFSENYPNHKDSLIKRLSKAKSLEDIDLQEIKSLLPESNWSKFFEEIVDWEGEQLNKKWERLYSLRNAIAHSQFISIGELQEIEELVEEVSPILNEAIDKLTQIIIPEEDLENVVENIASERNEQLGEFINRYKDLESTLSKLHQQISASNNSISKSLVPISKSLKAISSINLVPQKTLDQIKSISSFRNVVVHVPSIDMDHLQLSSKIAEISKLTESLNNEIKVNQEYHLAKIKDSRIIDLYQNIKDYILELEGVTVHYNKHYISFKLDRNIVDVKVQQKSVKVWFNVPYGELNDPESLTKDVSEIGHLGNGDYEATVRESGELVYLYSLIEQSYEYNKK